MINFVSAIKKMIVLTIWICTTVTLSSCTPMSSNGDAYQTSDASGGGIGNSSGGGSGGGGGPGGGR